MQQNMPNKILFVENLPVEVTGVNCIAARKALHASACLFSFRVSCFNNTTFGLEKKHVLL